MPEYLSPGVYVEEISTGPKAIEGVSTSTSGFVGRTERGPVHPRLVTSWVDYRRWFGGHIDSSISFLPFAVKGFFDNGGQRAFIARVHQSDATLATVGINTDSAQRLMVRAMGRGEWGNRMFVRVARPSQAGRDPNRPRFRLTFLYYTEMPPLPLIDPFDDDNIANADRRAPDVVEDYDNLGIDPIGPNYVINTVNGASQLVELGWEDESLAPSLPNFPVVFSELQMGGGGDGDPDANAIGAPEYLGTVGLSDPDISTGLAGLELIDQVSLLCIPDHVHVAIADADRSQIVNTVIDQCERLKDRFAVLSTVSNVNSIPDARISPPRDSSYGAIYYPWIRAYNPRNRDTLLVPPAGHVAGIMARTDIERGVHKAPANAEVRGIITQDLNGNRKPVQYPITKGQHDMLNPIGVNVIRDFRSDGRGIRVWGARTMSSDAEWKYINVRRLFIYIEESIDEGTQWVVFEPNYESTWARVKRSVSNFLISTWRSGALAGVTQDEAFFVKCDRTTMTQDDIDNGRLICYIGVAPVKPAEFVIFRISQKTVEATG